MPLAALIPAAIGAVGGAASAAALGTAAIGAGTALYSSSQQKKSANKALDAQTLANNQALAEQAAQRDRVTEANAPWAAGGLSAFDALLKQYNLGPGARPGATATSAVPSSASPTGYTAPTSSKTPGGMSANYGTPEGGPATVPGQAAGPAAGGTPDWAAFGKANPDIEQYWNQTPEAQKVPLENFLQQTYEAQKDIRGAPPMTPAAAQQQPSDPMNPQRANLGDAPQFVRGEQPTWEGAGPAPDAASYYSNFETSPDFNFRLQQGFDGANSGFAARGLLKSGAAAKGITDFASNLASGEYQNWFARQSAKLAADRAQYNQDRSTNYNIFDSERDTANTNAENDYSANNAQYWANQNRSDSNFAADRSYTANRYDTTTGNLFDLAQMGQNAANATSGAGQTYANNASNVFGSQANAASEAAAQRASANAGAVGSIAGAASNVFNNAAFARQQPAPQPVSATNIQRQNPFALPDYNSLNRLPSSVSF